MVSVVPPAASQGTSEQPKAIEIGVTADESRALDRPVPFFARKLGQAHRVGTDP